MTFMNPFIFISISNLLLVRLSLLISLDRLYLICQYPSRELYDITGGYNGYTNDYS